MVVDRVSPFEHGRPMAAPAASAAAGARTAVICALLSQQDRMAALLAQLATQRAGGAALPAQGAR